MKTATENKGLENPSANFIEVVPATSQKIATNTNNQLIIAIIIYYLRNTSSNFSITFSGENCSTICETLRLSMLCFNLKNNSSNSY